ncbi:Protein translocase subunit SecDF [Flavobacteriales bacterium]|nr:Protein translocase subunit SecDF [Flavobacteriales bacterium]
MQNRGAILTFTILLALACIYQLSFTWVASSVEKDAKTFSGGDLLLEERYLDSIGPEKVYPLFGFTFDEVKKNELNLGLDLKGGMNVILEVSVEDVLKGLASDAKDEVFVKTLSEAKKTKEKSQKDLVTLFGEAFTKSQPNGRLISLFYSVETKDKLTRDAANEEVLTFLREEANDAIDRCYQVLDIRTKQFGVAQPNIQKLEATDRIMVELPGVKNKERVRRLLQGTAKLEFWETYENAEIYPKLVDVNKKLASVLHGITEKDTTAVTDSTKLEESMANTADSTLKDSANQEKSLLEQLASESDSSSADSTQQSLEDFTKENPLFAYLRPAVFQNEQQQYYPGEGPVIGFVAIKDTGKINQYFSMPQVKAVLPNNIRLLWAAKPYDTEKRFLQLVAIKVKGREGKAPLEGDAIVNASQQFGQFGGRPEVELKMSPSGANTWKLLTRENIGKSIAIVLDNRVYSFPTVQGEIAGGISQITGNFTIDEAQDLANILKSGKLPAPAHIVQEAVVGPSLGKESISSGLSSFLLALIIVLAYMIFYYNRAGIAANVALLANLFFIIGVLASTNIALTLPGIAGIVLTIGMSVDANVLIFERIREELTAGKSLRLAVTDGYKNAYSSIIDSNVTTLLTGMILWFFGTGPIEGFAKTLVIGIITSLFSAIFITRLIFTSRLDKGKDLTFSTKLTQGLFKNVNIPFLARRKVFYAISSLIILAGVASIFTRGFSYGVDFSGGRTYIVRFSEPVSPEKVSASLRTYFVGEDGKPSSTEVKTFGSSNQVKITTSFLIDSEASETDEMVETKLSEALNSIASNFEILESQKVGPTIADDIKTSAIWSIVLSLFVIFLYILFRFKKWQFGLAALIALFHDVLIMLSVFSILYSVMPFSMEIDQAFIAAILTVVGYSINDTVVVFDRIREFLGAFKKREMNEVVNEAINSTLSRTINTSMTTFIVLLMIFIFGGDVIRGFIFALLIGIVVGTYSSICIATPIIMDLTNKKKLE